MTNPILEELEKLVPGYKPSKRQMELIKKSPDAEKSAKNLKSRMIDERNDAARALGINPELIPLKDVVAASVNLGKTTHSGSGADKKLALALGIENIEKYIRADEHAKLLEFWQTAVGKIQILYSVLFGRKPDKEGEEFYVRLLLVDKVDILVIAQDMINNGDQS